MIPIDADFIRKNYLSVKSDLNHQVRLIVVSKFQPIEKIRILLEEGHRDFGESRIQEILGKWSEIRKEYPEITLHYIGAIQSRKIRDIVKSVDYVHSLDRLDIAEKLNHECQLQNKTMKCFIQVNVGAEPQKAGIDYEQFPKFLDACHKYPCLSVVGAMCLPPLHEDPRPYFQSLNKLKEVHQLNELSMGMSNDYLEAIACGATMIRVGSKILGTRD